MKKNILRSCLVSPLIVGAFLSSGHVFADENIPTQATTVTENVQSTVNESESVQQNTDTNNGVQLSENQSVDQEQSDFNNQEAVSSETQETTEDNKLISPVISQETSDKAIKDENITTSESEQQETNSDVENVSPDETKKLILTESEQQETNSDVENVSPDETKKLILTDSKVSTSNIQALSQKVIDQLADSKVVKKETTSAALTAKGFDLQYNQAITPGAKIMFAVWSEVNGQDDLIWYTADSNGHAIAKYTGTYGLYNIHTYQNLNGQMKGLNGRTIDVPKPSAKVSIVKASDTIYKVTVSDVPAYITSIQLPTWTEKGGQDDIQWYGTTYNSDGTFTKTFSVAEHNFESGKYNVHYYGISSVTNTLTGLGGTSFNCDYQFGDIAITAQMGATGIEITMPQEIAKVANVSHAVWSKVRGQDDLKWYSDTTGHVVAPYTGDYGTYHVHTYANVNGKMICIGATSLDIPKPSAKVSIVKESGTTYKVIVSDVPAYITSIQLPIWTEKGGQDDIQWYGTTYNSDGTFTKTFSVAEHNFESGKYNVHYYGISSVTNTLTGLGGTSFNCDYQFGDIAITAQMGATGIEITMPQDIAKVANVSHAVWSEVKGQDDLKWYSDTTGHVVAPYTGDYGTYHVHTYANVNGKMICIGATSLDIPKPEVTVHIDKVTDYSAKITVTDVPIYIHDIQLPTWTSKNNQDDIKWYHATKQADGSYVYTFYAKNHRFESGHYNVHVYGTSEVTHSFVCLSGSDGIDLIFDETLTNPTVTVQNHDANGGTLKVRIAESENSKTIKLVRVAAWSESNQSNLHWYTSSDIHDGVVTVMVNEKNHDYIKGDYTVHVYVDFTDNTTSGFNLGTYRLNADKPVHAQSYFIDISSHNGVISVSEYQSLKRQGITGVVVKLTEGTSYTNPYARAQIANAQAAGLRVSAYHYSHYETAAEAKAEAQYFVNAAKSMGLSGATTMVTDMEEQAMLRSDLNANTQAWKDEMNRLGYNNNVYYTMASWLDVKGGKFKTSKFGMSNLWVAHYLYSTQYLDQESAKSLSYYSNSAAWQYTSVSPKLSHPLDESIDYTGRFTR
ncbi:GBS Bsp-like repeat-containing protein [Streptococcus equinus]|nr:GBS Bsp-like repeat-containing protein [Streptococcus equinus]SUN57142.1 N-acetylmuramoyl-L-alanine amidase [Streptococcus equinus]